MIEQIFNLLTLVVLLRPRLLPQILWSQSIINKAFLIEVLRYYHDGNPHSIRAEAWLHDGNALTFEPISAVINCHPNCEHLWLFCLRVSGNLE
jgi:hypothetical protein